MLNTPIKHEYSRVVLRRLDLQSDGELRPALDLLERDARTQLASDGFAADELEIVRELELRHPGQLGTIRVAVASGPLVPVAIAAHFRKAHQRLYGHVDPAAAIEIAGLFVVGIGRPPRIRLLSSANPSAPFRPVGERSVYFAQPHGRVMTRIYRGSDLDPGASLQGPAIIEEITTSVVVGPGDSCTVDRLGNYIIRPEPGDEM
jgi:N-methylhydantoinase A